MEGVEFASVDIKERVTNCKGLDCCSTEKFNPWPCEKVKNMPNLATKERMELQKMWPEGRNEMAPLPMQTKLVCALCSGSGSSAKATALGSICALETNEMRVPGLEKKRSAVGSAEKNIFSPLMLARATRTVGTDINVLEKREVMNIDNQMRGTKRGAEEVSEEDNHRRHKAARTDSYLSDV
ncbi:hypothetical protein FGB62_195g010 [Gracilaria domingensis]|nr:hypothetical protein FGB62_195g010 [Gracilaria domingensis]